MTWLRGGPFLELSFIIKEPARIEDIFSELEKTTVKIEVHVTPELVQQYYKGYPYDEKASNSVMIHKATISLTVHTTRQRNALLLVEKISSELISFSMCFFGSAFDAPEWNQPGIMDEEVDEFVSLLISLHKEIKFSLGCLAYEEDIKGLFDTEEVYPSEKYVISNLNIKDNFQKFQAIIMKKTLLDALQVGHHYTTIDNSCLLRQSGRPLMNWITLTKPEIDKAWNSFDQRFSFSPNVNPSNWPSITVNDDHFISYALTDTSDSSLLDLEMKCLNTLKTLVKPNEYIYALDWQHESFWFNPHLSYGERSWTIPFYPDGDYYIFFPKDIRWCYFSHPWEQSVTLIGGDLIQAFSSNQPAIFGKVLRKCLK
ncbi:Protein of unknown function [Cohnella sp. OV330]|uniref:DUF2716 domain-containing protein n=1 Tax=Cohnella sp. OV330 TaxID=1855288 RepID=UPI0008F318F7|nr:DUF2716 domain-containing protein [Cohnella sp. OV330]SFB06193.1 Protein of unknown function [Cohnella sp. OV330]